MNNIFITNNNPKLMKAKITTKLFLAQAKKNAKMVQDSKYTFDKQKIFIFGSLILQHRMYLVLNTFIFQSSLLFL